MTDSSDAMSTSERLWVDPQPGRRLLSAIAVPAGGPAGTQTRLNGRR